MSQVSEFRPAGLAAAEQEFLRRCPGFDPDGSFARLRETEYGRLDAYDQVYLDYTGGGLHAASQIDAHAAVIAFEVPSSFVVPTSNAGMGKIIGTGPSCRFMVGLL